VAEDLDKLIGAINAAESNSYGYDDDLASERALAIRYYQGENIEPAPDGRSQVVDRSLYETIQWMLPSLSRIFASGDDVVELPPVGPEDEKAAKQEAEYLNFIVLQRNNWFDIFNTAAKDALLTKGGYLYPYREKRRQVEIERYERQTEQGVALILQDGAEVVKLKEYPDPDYKTPPPQPMMQMGPQGPMPMMDPATGQPAMQPPQPPPMLYNLEIRRTKEDVRECILALPPERCRIAKTTTTVQLRDCSYFEYFDFPTLSDLRSDGYEIDDDIAADPDAMSEEDAARDRYAEDAFENDERTDPASRRVRCRWIWIRHDTDQDGIAELQYVVRVGSKIIHREECNRIPVAVLCADPLPHRHVGQGIADVTIDLQRIKTSILRQGLDNLYQTNNTRTFATDKINLDDLLTSRPGGIVRGKPGAIYGQDIMPIQVPFVFPQAMEGLAYMDQVRDYRTGVNSNFAGIEKGALGSTQSGVAINQLSTMAAQRVEQIARNFANGITEMFAILHEIVQKGGHKQEVVKLRGEWVEINPAEWRSRSDFKISVGYAAGNKDALVSRLQLIASQQMAALQLGLPIVNPRNVYETNIELAKAADMSTPERFFQDPSQAPPPQPPQPDPTIMAAEQMKTQSAERIKQAELQSEERLKQSQMQLDKYKADLDSNTSLSVEQMRNHHAARVEEFRAKHSVGMKQIEGQQSAQLEEHRAKFNPKHVEATSKAKQTDATSELLNALAHSHAHHTHMLGEVLKAVSAPKRIVRDKGGRAIGTETVTQ
jgi:hypothetical protein